MEVALSYREAVWLLPFALPICFYVAWSDCRSMIIPNRAVIALIAVFLVVGLVALPVSDWAWRLTHLVAILLLGMVLNAAGAIGAGDAKFAAAAAPFVALPDLPLMMVLLAAAMLAAFATHRIVKHSPLRRLAPAWKSWQTGADFPMGLALGPVLVLYLALGLLHGSGG